MSAEEIIVKSLPIDIEEGAVYSIAQSNPNSFTHCFFKYPCKFIPEIPRWAISKYIDREGCHIYDPFSGSGTTLVEAALMGHFSYGSEIDATAKLITRAKTTKMSPVQLDLLKTTKENIISYANNPESKKIVANINNIEHWFPANNIDELGKIRQYIETIQDSTIKDFCLVCFASIIKKVSFCDDVSPKPYVSSKVIKTPESAITAFSGVFDRYSSLIREYSKFDTQVPTILPGGALGLKEKNKFDLAITSPPYINAFDYARSMRLENLWLGFESEDSIRCGKGAYVGTEKVSGTSQFGKGYYLADSPLLHTYLDQIIILDKKRAAVTNKFFVDMKINMEQVHAALKPGGKYVIVIGNSSIRKVEVESWKVLAEIGEKIGFSTELHFSYSIKNPYIRIPREGQGGKINQDHVIVLTKI